MTGRTFRVFAFLALAALGSAPAGATVLDFEGILDGTPVTNQFPGVAFTNASAIASGLSLNDLEFPPRSGTVVVFDDGGPMTILFGAPQASVGAFFTYTVPITLTAFDAGDAVLAADASDFASNLFLSGEIGSIGLCT